MKLFKNLKSLWRTSESAAQQAVLIAETGRFWKKIKFQLRHFALGNNALEWSRFLESKEMEFLTLQMPRVHLKIQRPYLYKGLTPIGSLSALTNHYRFFLKRFHESNRPAVVSPGIVFQKFELPKVGPFEIFLGANLWEQEGELGIGLRNSETREIISTIVFTIIAWNEQKREILIGGLQGRNTDTNRAILSAITKEMHGLRPKALLVFALQECAKSWGVDSIRAVSNRLHIFRSWRKKKKIHADYDAFWRESGGVLDADGFYALPQRWTQRDLGTVSPNKRSMYRKRYGMLEDVASSIEATLQRVSTSLVSDNEPAY